MTDWHDRGVPPSGARQPSIPTEVASLANCFLTTADSIVPGLVRGLYLTGSVALGDFRSHCSDVDFVAVSESRPDGAELEGLAKVHWRVVGTHPKLHFDGIHLTWSDLQQGPKACAPAPFTLAGRFKPSGAFAIDPITWHELADHGVRLRGPPIAGIGVWQDKAMLREWTLGNLVEYWRPWTAKYRESPPTLDGDHEPVCWGVLGVARLHYTLTTGCIASKTASGE